MILKKYTFLLFLLIPLQCYNQEITVNQVGYLVGNPKLADVPGSETGNFKIVNVYTHVVKYTAALSDAVTWTPSEQDIRIADFTPLNDTGTYRIEIEGSATVSDTFRIGNEVYMPLCHDAMRYYYLDRASLKLLPQYAGIYARDAGHPDNHVLVHSSAASAARPEGTVISTPGGWYDAGDYNKYVVNAGISTYTVFAIAEDFPDFAVSLDNNIPESSNNVPDIIDEAVYDLRWMLCMQDPNDGGVYHKCTTKNFEGFVAPKNATQQRYVVMKTTAATLDMAAVAAQASRILRNYETAYPGLADSCINAARYAYKWAQAHPTQYYSQPSDISTGSYGDANVTDEFHWAAMELYVTTHNEKYLFDYDYLYTDAYAPGWGSVYPLGLISMMRNSEDLTSSADISAVEQKLIKTADQFYNDYINSAYKVPATSFYWGSNSGVANGGLMSLQAYAITHDPKYVDAAAAALDYLLGRNPTRYSYVTGYGTKSPMHPHDRKSSSDGVVAPIPGMLVGGANPSNTDDCGSSNYPSLVPALSYYDNTCSYSTNEIAINWNAPLAYLACGLQAIQLRDPKPETAFTGNSDSTVVFLVLSSTMNPDSIKKNDFSISVNNGIPLSVDTVMTIPPDTLAVKLTGNISADDTNILISYVPGNLTSFSGIPTDSIINFPVINQVRGSAPVEISAVTEKNSNNVHLSFTKNISGAEASASGFSLMRNSDTLAINTVNYDGNDSTTLILSVNGQLTSSDSLTLNYDDSTLFSTDGGVLRAFSIRVKNMLYLPSAPDVVRLTPGGFELSLSFTKPLVDTSVHPEEFILGKNNGMQSAVLSATLSSDMRSLKLVLANEVLPSDTALNLSYTGNHIISTQNIAVKPFGPLNLENNTVGTPVIPGRLEAEYYRYNTGFGVETTSDDGAGENLTGAGSGDHTDYRVQVSKAGLYTVSYRVATASGNTMLELSLLSGTPLDTVVFPYTGGYNTWQTAYGLINLDAGEQWLRITALSPYFKLNWLQFDEGDQIPTNSIQNGQIAKHMLNIFPNPVERHHNIVIDVNPGSSQKVNCTLIDMRGKKLFEQLNIDLNTGRNHIELNTAKMNLSAGVYIIRITGEKFFEQSKVNLY